MSNEDTFDDALQGGIRDRAKEAKKTRQKMKSSFTRKYNAFQYLVKAEVQDNELKEAYDDLVRAYEALEKSQLDYTHFITLILLYKNNLYKNNQAQVSKN